MNPSLRAVGVATVGVSTVLGTVFAGVELFGSREATSQAARVATEPQTGDGPETPAEPGLTPTAGTASPAALGQCLLEGKPSPCDDAHNGQVVGLAANCDVTEFVRFGGGDPGREVIGSAVAMKPMELAGVTVCTVQMAAPQWASAEGILATRKGDFARRCFHDTSRQETGCDVPHTREAVAVRAPGDASDIVCEDAARQYLGIDLQRFASELTVERSTSSRGTTCWVKARGHNVLTGSIRSVGTKALPLRAMN